MRAAGALAFVLRESRGARGRLVFFALCVAIGVAAVVAVASLAAALGDGLRRQSRGLLAADLQLSAHQPFGPGFEELLDELAPGARSTRVRELATMAGAVDAAGDVVQSRLVELKVLQGRYPFYGDLVLSAADGGQPSLEELLSAADAVVAPELLAVLGLEPGDTLRLGGADFHIAGRVHEEPGRLGFSLTLGPRVFLSQEGLERTQLLGVGNRVRHRRLVALAQDLDADALHALGERLVARGRASGAVPATARLTTHHEAQPGVRRGLERFQSYLGLVALFTLILGGIGVAEVVRSWLRSKTVGIAVWRSLGLRAREILWLYLAHALALALLGSLLGAVLGGLLPFLLPRWMPDLLDPAHVRPWQPLALARGLALGVGVAGLFALPVLTSVWRVPPAMVLRSAAEPLPAPRAVRVSSIALLALGLFASAWLQAGRADHALGFSLGIAACAGLLYAGARVLVRLARAVPREGLPAAVAHGVGALARPGAGTVGAIVALGLGSLVVVAMALVDRVLGDELRGALPTDAPSVFLVDVQADQWPEVRAVLEESGATRIDMVPVVMARLARPEPGGGSGEDPDGADGDRRSEWARSREQRLTYLEELPASNRIVAGELWSDPDHFEVSMEEEYAERLGLELGDRVRFDVQGVELELLLTSLREVTWESFEINFFLVVEPGVLEDAPQFRLVAARLAAEREDEVQNRMVAGFPNVTTLRVRPLIEKVAELLRRIALGVRLLGASTVLAGVAILAGAVSATQLRRGREVALLKTLGVRRRGVLALFATEFALAGLVAGGLGVLGAYALAWGFLDQVLELPADLPWQPALPAALGTAALSTGAGLAASARALAARPLESLRAE